MGIRLSIWLCYLMCEPSRSRAEPATRVHAQFVVSFVLNQGFNVQRSSGEHLGLDFDGSGSPPFTGVIDKGLFIESG